MTTRKHLSTTPSMRKTIHTQQRIILGGNAHLLRYIQQDLVVALLELLDGELLVLPDILSSLCSVVSTIAGLPALALHCLGRRHAPSVGSDGATVCKLRTTPRTVCIDPSTMR